MRERGRLRLRGEERRGQLVDAPAVLGDVGGVIGAFDDGEAAIRDMLVNVHRVGEGHDVVLARYHIAGRLDARQEVGGEIGQFEH